MNQKVNQLIDLVDNLVRKIIKRLAVFLNWLSYGKITPNMITISGLLLHLIVAWCIIDNKLILAAILLIIFGLFDTLDGELARLQKKQSAIGSLLDASTDRFKEVILYSAIAYFFIHHNQDGFAVWTVMACGFSICVSYVRAKGEAIYLSLNKNINIKNKIFKNGFLRFEVRMLLLAIGLLVNKLTWVIVIIAILSLFTAINRLINISSQLNND
ncbi:MAG TPA: CDP-alcohol phosphatidyltransferase family protein [Candidatus Saccharimonadales bacterium]